MKAEMPITGERKNNAFVVTIKGPMNLDSSDLFNSIMDRYIDENEIPFIINCKKLKYINSTGLRSFIYITQRLSDLNRNLLFCELQAPVREVIDIAGMGTFFKIFSNEKEAFKNL